MLADYHVHTQYSDDSTYPMEQVIKDAVSMQMHEICFTDHVDYGIKEDWDCGHPLSKRGEELLANVDYPAYTAEIAGLRERYGDQIKIRLGMEFGMQVHTIAKYEALFAKYPFDFILLSIHQVEDQEFWNQDFQQGRSQREYNERYYEEMLAVIRAYKNYSVLGHMDLIARYDLQGIYPFARIRPLVVEILKTVLEDGKGLEFNTSYHRYGLSDTTPCTEILKLYREMGGEILTIGSDSHQPEHLGQYIEEAKKHLTSLGFRYFCTFDHMQPVYHRL